MRDFNDWIDRQARQLAEREQELRTKYILQPKTIDLSKDDYNVVASPWRRHESDGLTRQPRSVKLAHVNANKDWSLTVYYGACVAALASLGIMAWLGVWP